MLCAAGMIHHTAVGESVTRRRPLQLGGRIRKEQNLFRTSSTFIGQLGQRQLVYIQLLHFLPSFFISLVSLELGAATHLILLTAERVFSCVRETACSSCVVDRLLDRIDPKTMLVVVVRTAKTAFGKPGACLLEQFAGHTSTKLGSQANRHTKSYLEARVSELATETASLQSCATLACSQFRRR